eukprot:CAMPEP_0174363736 /NCGR_PEP_ID=MMETSP0811_2-20130205/69997_1 /TAXON_ID=73025 ORGANISM="Eutreptiella gymnastica-like, Strain CCMP1594" /NCGR_SAMPLE_ID=MMETSP0811_2 /ASSEMBLY_ACC=CAM_ASM_000667 /LENGTH=147 /DNA_ID=CAMNT_0015502687 /DNA_START=198 /DNA_END=642 /DNA_ORIENTATION=-
MPSTALFRLGINACEPCLQTIKILEVAVARIGQGAVGEPTTGPEVAAEEAYGRVEAADGALAAGGGLGEAVDDVLEAAGGLEAAADGALAAGGPGAVVDGGLETAGGLEEAADGVLAAGGGLGRAVDGALDVAGGLEVAAAEVAMHY